MKLYHRTDHSESKTKPNHNEAVTALSDVDNEIDTVRAVDANDAGDTDGSSNTKHAHKPSAADGLHGKAERGYTGKLLRYRADWKPLSLIGLVFTLQLLVFFLISHPLLVALCELVLLVPQMSISAYNHHHSHLNAFRSPVLNAPLNLILALQTGIPTFGWVLHHNLGHHLDYLDLKDDPSSWTRPDGSRMGMGEYILINVWRMYPNMFLVGRKHPRLARRLILQMIVIGLTLAALIAHNPVNTLIVFIIPMIIKPALTFLATYSQHAGLYARDHMHASYNILSKSYNAFFWNLGYHTAHHIKMGVHWSVLPEYHARIADTIPDELYISGGQPWRWLDG